MRLSTQVSLYRTILAARRLVVLVTHWQQSAQASKLKVARGDGIFSITRRIDDHPF